LLSGDLGGPIFQWEKDHWQQVGIASHTTDGCTKGSPVGYTRVAYYDDWIARQMSNDTSSITSLIPASSTTVGPTVYECDRNLVTCGCGQNPVEFLSSRILGSQEAVPYSWSMVVSIRFRGSGKHACGGSILGESHILTSASCIADAPVFGITIAGGTHNYSEGHAAYRRVDGVFIHPDYTGSVDNYINDIAILHLSQPLDLPFDTYLAQTCLSPAVSSFPNPIYYPSSEALLAVVGWGLTNYENRTDPQKLHQAEVYAANLSDPNCAVMNGHDDLQFCAGVEQGGKGCFLFYPKTKTEIFVFLLL
jgi:secreted trypsin-like serine protease